MPKLPRNIYRRGDRFYLCASVDGRRIRKSLGTRLDEAKRKAALELARLRSGPREPDPEPALTVAAFGTRWLAEYVNRKRTKKDRRTTAYRFQEYVCAMIGSLPLSEVRLDHLMRLAGSLEAKGLKPLTVRHVLSDVRCLFRYGVKIGVLDRSPWDGVAMPKVKKDPPARLTRDEVARILEALPEEHFRLPVLLALATGLRWGELARLQWRHVVWEPHPHLVLGETKSGEVRRVPLTGEAAALLREERARTSSVYVLPWRPVNPRWIATLTGRRTGIRWHFHRLRHTMACEWLVRGGSKEVLRRILGHASIVTTERYGELDDEATWAELERLEKVSGSEPATKGATPDCVRFRVGSGIPLD